MENAILQVAETIDDINLYYTDKPEVASLPMIKPPLDSIDAAIRIKAIRNLKVGFHASFYKPGF